jgi:hypothetical protein
VGGADGKKSRLKVSDSLKLASMPTIFSHIAVPIAAAVALGSKRIPPSMLLAGMVAAILPDFDGVAFKLGLHYGGIWGHRGFTHTLGFALVAGFIGWWLARHWKLPSWQGYAWIALCMFSHPAAGYPDQRRRGHSALLAVFRAALFQSLAACRGFAGRLFPILHATRRRRAAQRGPNHLAAADGRCPGHFCAPTFPKNPMNASQNLLVELFVEELPPKALKKLGDAFAGVLFEQLKAQGLTADASALTAFASPRRLAAHVTAVAAQAADKAVSQKLMPVAVGLDASGNATPALLKKLQALGADASAVAGLKRAPDGKAEALFYDSTVKGATLVEGLQKALLEAIAKLPIPKVMTYQLADGWSDVKFVRPRTAWSRCMAARWWPSRRWA